MPSLLRTLGLLALPLLAVGGSVECCDITIDPLSPGGVSILAQLGLAGLAFLDVGGLGINCTDFEPAAILDGSCTSSNIVACGLSLPFFGGSVGILCNPVLNA